MTACRMSSSANTVGRVQTRSGAEVDIDGGVVVKLHRPATDPQALETRLRIAARLDCFLSPLSTQPDRAGSRWRTRWPKVATVQQNPDQVPWPNAARLLARLHSHTFDEPLDHGGRQRLRRALGSLPDTSASATIRRAAATLPDRIWDTPQRTLVHGDWHLGQIGWRAGEWLLIDIDDLGGGHPAWDLARPAGFWAAGVLPDADWAAFLDAYREAGGNALRSAPADPWPVLDPFARAAVIVAAAGGVIAGVEDEAAEALVEACGRMH